MPALFLAMSLWGALFTINALRPSRRLIGLSFYPAWLTTELALHHVLWQAVATVVFIALGALTAPMGWLGLGITLLSWSGLGHLLLSAHRDGRVVHSALEAALGPGFSDEIDPDHARHMRASVDWTRVLAPFLIGRRGVECIRDIPYLDDGNPRHHLDIYRRTDVAHCAPVLLQIHGGRWMIGRKEQQGLPLMHHLAVRGWVCVAINYSLSPAATWPAHLVDCKLALKWIRQHIAAYGGNPNLVVVTGGSAGGHLATMLALTANQPEFQPGFEEVDTRVQAFIPFYGVFDWSDRFGIRGNSDPMKKRLERHIMKRPRHEDPHAYHWASPMSHLQGEIPPAMLLHGTSDTIAPVAEARRFVDMLRERSVEPVVYAEFSGAHHAFELFPSVRALHAINGVEAFAAWVASRSGRPKLISPWAGAPPDDCGPPPP
jgi:acetyl esterase/lipase